MTKNFATKKNEYFQLSLCVFAPLREKNKQI